MRHLISISFIFVFECVSAQKPEGSRHFSIGLGTNHVSLQDEVFSPLVYRGAGFLLDVNYYDQKAKRMHDVQVGISSQELTPKLNPQGSGRVENTNMYLDYEYLRNFAPNKNHHLGIGLYNFLSARNFIFLVEDDISLDIFTSLNLVYAYRLSLEDQHHFGIKTSLPLMAYVLGRMSVPNDFSEAVFQSIVEDPNSTPTGEILKSGDFLAFTRFFDLRFTLDYLYDLSKKFGVGVTYSFQYYNYAKFQKVRYGASQYVFRLAYKL